MKKLNSRILCGLMALLMVFSLLPGITLTSNAATVDYQKVNVSSTYPNVIKNWGTREEIATFLSPNAEAFYEDTTYEELASLNGSSNLTVVNTSALYAALYKLMSGAHTTKNSYEESKNLFQYTDCQDNGNVDSGKISTFYSGILAGPEWDSGATFTREHTWPDSMGGSADTTASARTNETDMMMLRPIPQSENSGRSNTPYGESNGYYHPNRGSYDVRGDAARTILYVYVRWGNEQSAVLENIWNVFESKEILLSWIEEDPVDTWEMGRNDSVESITGTRNVFVDYPELAFKLFNETVPQMTTPSGNAGAAGYQITAKANNAAYGSVSVSGNVITATPASGYYASGYQVTSGSATVTQNGNIFIVKPSSACTVTINFALAHKYTVQIKENGAIKSSSSVQENTTYTLPELTSSLPENHTFIGWSSAEVSETNQKPAVYAAGEKVTISANTTFYAVVAVKDPTVEGGSNTWKLVTSNSQISSGDQVIIAAKDYDFAVSTNQKTNNRGQAAITKSGNTLTYDSEVAVFTLEAGTVSGSYGFNTGSGYLYVFDNSNNYLRTQSNLDDAASFYISAASDGTCSVTSAAYSTADKGNVPMQYNYSSKLFSCYPRATQTALSLYVAQSAMGATTYSTSWKTACDHTNTSSATIPATCTVDGKITVTCDDCGEILSTTVIPSGHQYQYETIKPTLSAGGYTLESCSVCGDETKEDEVPPLTTIESWNLTLASDLSVNFKIDVDESIRSTAKIHILVADEPQTYLVSGLTVKADGYYYVSVNVAASQMTDEITVYITNGTDQSEMKTYFVKSYAETILIGDYSEELQNLMLRMLYYGAAAQDYFNYREDWFANSELESWDDTHRTPTTGNAYSVQGKLDGISFYGASMLFRDRIALRYYFTVTGDIADYTFTANDAACTPVQKGAYYYIEVADINPQDLDNKITVKVNDTMAITYSPMNYVVNMYANGSDEMKALAQALYDYYWAAGAYLATIA